MDNEHVEKTSTVFRETSFDIFAYLFQFLMYRAENNFLRFIGHLSDSGHFQRILTEMTSDMRPVIFTLVTL